MLLGVVLIVTIGLILVFALTGERGGGSSPSPDSTSTSAVSSSPGGGG